MSKIAADIIRHALRDGPRWQTGLRRQLKRLRIGKEEFDAGLLLARAVAYRDRTGAYFDLPKAEWPPRLHSP